MIKQLDEVNFFASGVASMMEEDSKVMSEQVNHVIQECGELIVALTKHEPDSDEVLEEACDVVIMALQLINLRSSAAAVLAKKLEKAKLATFGADGCNR